MIQSYGGMRGATLGLSLKLNQDVYLTWKYIYEGGIWKY